MGYEREEGTKRANERWTRGLYKVREQVVQMSGEEHPRQHGGYRDPEARALVVVPRKNKAWGARDVSMEKEPRTKLFSALDFILVWWEATGRFEQSSDTNLAHFPVVTRLLLGRQAGAVWREGTRAVGRSYAVLVRAGLEQHSGGVRTGWIPDRFWRQASGVYWNGWEVWEKSLGFLAWWTTGWIDSLLWHLLRREHCGTQVDFVVIYLICFLLLW